MRAYLWPHTQVSADEQGHIVRAVGAADGAALPPPLPDVPGGEARVELCVWRWVIAIAKPQQGANSTPGGFTRTIVLPGGYTRGRLIAFIPPCTHVVLVVQVFASLPLPYSASALGKLSPPETMT